MCCYSVCGRGQTLRILNGCSVQIENSVTRVTVRHHTAIPSDGIFSSHRTTSIDSFSCTLPSTIVFKLGYALFYQFYAEISTFSIKKCSIRSTSTTTFRRHARGRLTPPGIRRKYPERVKIAENLVEYARNKGSVDFTGDVKSQTWTSSLLWWDVTSVVMQIR